MKNLVNVLVGNENVDVRVENKQAKSATITLKRAFMETHYKAKINQLNRDRALQAKIKMKTILKEAEEVKLEDEEQEF